MNRRALFYCNTPYQLMVAINIKKRILQDQNADVIISNHAMGMDAVAENLRKENVFQKVYFVEICDYDKGERILFNENSFSEKYFGTKVQVEKVIRLEATDYTDFWLAGPTRFSRLVYSYLCLMNHKKVNCNCFEDGLSTYCDAENWFHVSRTWKEKIVCILERWTEITKGLKNIYVFKPEFMQWTPTVPVLNIPQFDCNDTEMMMLLNRVFDYQVTDKNNYQFIFFDSNFKALKNDDVDLMLEVADAIGMEKVIVKLHPRSTKNRFKAAGFATNEVRNVPSELILLNSDLEHTCLVSVFSTALVVPYFAFGLKLKNYTIMGIMNIKVHNTMERMYDLFIKLHEAEPEIFRIPHSKEELVEELRNASSENVKEN